MPVFCNLYDSPLFVMIRPDGIFVVEPPARGPKRESVLRVFTSLKDAITYKNQDRQPDGVIRRTTLVGLWALLGNINILSLQSFAAPVRIEASSFNSKDEVFCYSVLHSVYTVLN